MSEAKPIGMPADPHMVLSPVTENDTKTVSVPYRETVGSLMFVAVVSRPDIVYTVSSISRFLNNLNNEHWQAVKRIFSYLVGTNKCGIEFHGCGNKLQLQLAIPTLTTRATWKPEGPRLESKYVAAAAASREATWLRKLLRDLGYRCVEATVIFVNNKRAIKLVKNPKFYKRRKHIGGRHHYIREKEAAGEIALKHVSTKEQKANIFTKVIV
ncbi:hypothetical protein KM043_014340 [Ampulex compressa]|nr:hypothetical protein KM043_014340 [Ampulex compressa]